VNWKEYGYNLAANLQRLHQRLHTQRYKPQPVLRAWRPKPNGEQRPIGITAVEDKIVQQALVWVLEQIYEVDFLEFSYGFRRNRNQHQALDATYIAITQRKVSWILDADMSKFFDTLNHDWLLKFLQHRIADKRLLELIEKTVKAGVVDNERFYKAELGSPQGAVISPLLANIYMHYVLDLWVRQWRGRYARGECHIVRYADDCVLGFQYNSDGRQFMRALEMRLDKFGLKLNRSKTHLIEFGRFAVSNRKERGQGKPATFDFLGFTHICSTRRSDGRFMLKRFTITKKLRAKLKQVKADLMKRRSQDVYKIGKWLGSVVQGHANYYGVPGNSMAINLFQTQCSRAWLRALRRRVPFYFMRVVLR
jgi:group II intron reverse transcriptase/maturase